MKVLKFGGSSVANAKNIKKVIHIISSSLKEDKDSVVVVSALGGVTNTLIKMADLASQKNSEYHELFNKNLEIHKETINDLMPFANTESVFDEINVRFQELDKILEGIYLLGELSLRSLDSVMSYGEQFSSYIISSALNILDIPCLFVDAKNIIKTDENFGSAKVDFKKTYHLISKQFPKNSGLSLIGGFIASTENNYTTTLGRGGSDYTASLIGAAINANLIEIWTDVDGVLTADPGMVDNAFPLSNISYEEAGELAHFGAKVIHPKTMKPARLKNIPIYIKNTFNPKASGTLINNDVCGHKNNFPVQGISSLDGVSLLRIQSNNSNSIGKITSKVLDVLSQSDIEILLVSQASYEQSVSIAVETVHTKKSKDTIENAFHLEMQAKHMNPVVVEDDLSIVSIVGKQMKGVPGISGTLFETLGKNCINVFAIAQGSSEINVSAVINSSDQSKALQAIHEVFFKTYDKSISLFVLGSGLIASTLLEQIRKSQIPIRLVGIANSKQMLINTNGIPLDFWKQSLSNGSSYDLQVFVDHVINLGLPKSVLVDCTASEEVILIYQDILSASIPIVTPNKKANSGSYKLYKKLQTISKSNNVPFFYETNVGAGLPIIHTIRDLVSSGDRVEKIEAVLSGTLSYIFNTFSESNDSFSQIVLNAKEKGYTEPDPRDDLNGMDVARKILILARETGLKMEIDDVKNTPLLPKECFETCSIEDFFEELTKLDSIFEEKKTQGKDKGKVLCFIAKLENGQAEIGLQEIDSSHPFYSLSGTDNIVSITTDRYCDTPLVIKGPGAGSEVTAGGVFADILRIFK